MTTYSRLYEAYSTTAIPTAFVPAGKSYTKFLRWVLSAAEAIAGILRWVSQEYDQQPQYYWPSELRKSGRMMFLTNSVRIQRAKKALI